MYCTVLYCVLHHPYHNMYCIGSEPAIRSTGGDPKIQLKFVMLPCSQPYHFSAVNRIFWIFMPAVNRSANPPPCLTKCVKFSMKVLFSDITDLKTAFQTFYLFSGFAKCEKKLELFFLFRLKVEFLDLRNIHKTIPNAFSKMPHGIKGRLS